MQQSKSLLSALVISSALLALPASAQNDTGTVISASPPAGSTPTTRDLELIQAETVLYEARALRAKAILSWQQNGNGLDSPLPVNMTPASGDHTQEASAPSPGALPRILEISGTGKQLRTRLLMANGTVVEAAVGQRLPGTVYSVSQISPRGVQLKSDDGKLHSPYFSE